MINKVINFFKKAKKFLFSFGVRKVEGAIIIEFIHPFSLWNDEIQTMELELRYKNV